MSQEETTTRDTHVLLSSHPGTADNADDGDEDVVENDGSEVVVNYDMGDYDCDDVMSAVTFIYELVSDSIYVFYLNDSEQ